MINVIVFSKDRPLQLEACIKSLIDYNDDKKNIHIIYKTSNQQFNNGYNFLKKSLEESCIGNQKIFWHPEINFYKQTINLIKSDYRYTMFLVDDIIFIDKFSTTDKQFNLLNYQNMLTLSLRLHKNITKCYATGRDTKVPKFTKECIWNWESFDGDWGYPFSVDGNVFKTKIINDVINNLQIQRINFNNPNTFEAGMDILKKYIPIQYMCCYPEGSKLINIPANRVQNTFNNKFENSASPENLLELFNNNKKIDYKLYYKTKQNSVHCPLKIKIQ